MSNNNTDFNSSILKDSFYDYFCTWRATILYIFYFILFYHIYIVMFDWTVLWKIKCSTSKVLDIRLSVHQLSRKVKRIII